MKSVSISGSLRENVGKRDAKAQRAQGLVPCVLYGGTQQYTFVVEEGQFKNLIYTPEVRYAELALDGKIYTAIIQESQFHAITDRLQHVDFLEVVDGKPITIGIPIKVVGTSPGILRGGRLVKKMRKLTIRGELQNIPEVIEVDITPLEINDAVKVADIKINNLQFIDNPANVVLSVQPTRNMEAAPVAE